jgi:hypothetical protein
METMDQEKITLRCVRESGKLRIRFHSYTNHDGKEFTNVYNNDYNCQFPKAIREEGKFYEVGPHDMAIVGGNGTKSPFYRIKKGNIKIVEYNGAVTAVILPPPSRKRGKKGLSDNISSSGSLPSSNAPSTVAVLPQQVYEVNECVICLEAKPNQVFIPCAHLCTCSDCYSQMKSNNKPSCPLCRRFVTTSILQQ